MSFKILLAGVGLASVLFACGGSTSDGDAAAQSQAGAGGNAGSAGGAGLDAGGAGGSAGTGVSGSGSGGTGLGSAGAGSGGSSAAGVGGQSPGGSGGGKPAASAAEIAELCDGLCKTLDAKNAEVGCAPSTTCASSCEPTVSAFFASCVSEYASLVDCAKEQPASAFTCDPKMGAQLNDGACKAEADKLEACAGF